MKLTILISGSGSNFQSIIDDIDSGELQNVEIVKVIADRECQGINRAIDHDINHDIVSRKRDDFKKAFLTAIPKETDLIVCAGFLSIIPKDVINAFPKKIINIHPSLLPKYGGKGMYGMNVHRAVIDKQEVESGCTVHYVDHGIDTGEIIIQKKVGVFPGDTPEKLQQRILKVEHQLLPEAIRLITANKMLRP